MVKAKFLSFKLSIGCLLILIMGCQPDNKITLPGYVEGRYIYIATNYSGLLESIYVNPGDFVKSGQPLFKLEPLPESANFQAATALLQQAKDQLEKAQSNFDLQQAEIKRKKYLYAKDVISKEEFDKATSVYLQAYSDISYAKSNINIKKADLEKANWINQQKIVNSPNTSLVTDIFYNNNELVQGGNPVIALLQPSKIKIIFFVPEILLSHIALKKTIDVTCDTCRAPIKAGISYIANNAEYTSPLLYSSDVRTTLAYRIEALPQVDNVLNKLHPGQPVSVNIERT